MQAQPNAKIFLETAPKMRRMKVKGACLRQYAEFAPGSMKAFGFSSLTAASRIDGGLWGWFANPANQIFLEAALP